MQKKYTPCGGCGATNPMERCIGCFHPFESTPPTEPKIETAVWLNLADHFTEDWEIMHCRYADDKRKLDTDLFELSDGWLIKKGGIGKLELHEVEYMAEGKEVQNGTKWVKADHKPEYNVGVLVFIPGEDNHITSGMWDISNEWVLLDEYRTPEEEVTHWMELPLFPDGYKHDVISDELVGTLKAIANEELAKKGKITKDDWISVTDQLPAESGRYWCYVEELTNLGFTHFQWNCYFDEKACKFSDSTLTKGENVTHWRLLPAPPSK